MAGFGKLLSLGLKSTLEEAVEKAPKTIPGEQVMPFLKGQGVTSDEMKFSGVTLPTEGPVAREELQSAVSMRTDQFGIVDRNQKGPISEYSDAEWYQSVNVLGVDGRPKELPTYRERIYTYKKGHEQAITTSEHFPSVENYHAHTRIQDDMVGGKNTRVVLEMQSDTLATSRGRGIPREQIDNFNVSGFVAGSETAINDLADMLGKSPMDPNFLHSERRLRESLRVARTSAEAKEELTKFLKTWDKAAEQPYAKTMVPKLLEREILTAQEEGHTRLAIPLEGYLRDLQRGGNQAMYETKVRSQMQKLAKQNGWQYEEVVEELPGVDAKRLVSDFNDDMTIMLSNMGVPSIKLYEKGAPTVNIAEKLDEAYGIFDIITDNLQTTIRNRTGKNVPALAWPDELAGLREAAHTAFKRYGESYSGKGATFDDISYLDIMDKAVADPSTLIEKILDANQSILADAGMGQSNRIIYGVIDMADEAGLPKKPNKHFTMYSSPAAGAFAAYGFLSAGLSEQDAKKRMKDDGFDDDDIAQAFKDTKFIAQMYAQGVPEARVRQYLEGEQPQVEKQETINKQPIGKPGSYWNQDAYGEEGPKSPLATPTLPTMQQQLEKEGENLAARQQRETRNWARHTLNRPATDNVPTHELVASLRVVYPEDSTPHTMLMALGGDQESLRVMEQNSAGARAHIIEAIKRHTGVDAYFDEDFGGYLTLDGQPLDKGFWSNIWADLQNSEAALTLGVAGGATGAIAGAQQGARLGPYGAAAGALIGGITGGAIGGGVGSQLDYLRHAIRLSEEMNGEIMARKAISEAEFAVIGDLAGAALIKLGKGAGGKATQLVRQVIDFAKAKDTVSAKEALKSHLHISDQELDEIAAGLNRLTQIEGITAEEQKLAAAVLTQPGGETIMTAVVRNTPRTGQALVRQVNSRAQNLLKSADSLTDPNAARLIVQDLDNYTMDVKALFTDVKNRAATSTVAGAYKFDIDKIAVEPVVMSMRRGVSDMQQRAKLLNQIRQIKSINQTRSFTDLLELRKLVNSLKYTKGAQDYAGQLDGVLKSIDGEIQKGAFKAVDDPQRWLLDWKAANAAYSEMKVLERNVLFKSLTRPGMSPKNIGKTLYKYSTSLDDTYVSVMAKLPKQTRRAAEAEILDIVANKFTMGMEGGWRATDFPALAKELEQIPLTSPEARKLQQAVIKMADVFRNDPALASVSGEIPLPKFQSYLTADPVVRAKFALASGVFKKVKELVPGDMHNNMALVNILTEVLDKPLNAKLLDQLAKEAGDRIDISAQLAELTQAVARKSADAADEGAPRLAVYGEGKILSTKPTDTAKVKGESIPMHRIATVEDAKVIAAAEGVNPSDVKLVDEILKARGYKAVQHGTNKVRRLD